MNILDVIVIGVALAAGLRGWRRGLLGQAFELGGGFLGLLAGIALGPRVAGLFSQSAGIQAALISLFAVFVLFSLGQSGGYVVGHRFGRMARNARLGPVDSGLGSGFGAVVTLLSFWLVGSLLIQGPSAELARAFQHSRVLRAMNDTMPDPPNILAYIRQYLDTSGFPQVFAGMPPPVGEPVQLPGNRAARRAVRAAEQSTVRVVVPACGGTQLGSGWVAAPDVVVTNAHVVAGGTEITIQDRPGNSHSGRVVVFDPQIDVAVVRTQGLTAGGLALDTTRYERGEPGATLGYPGALGGRMDVHRAAVQAVYDATGKDIYGRGNVSREVYELRSQVRQGASGGPFVLPSGTVAGVVFAASTTNNEIGYALTGAQVEQHVNEGLERTQAVGTGRCTH